jgi:tetratricopeptide (TPR) repeat protein
VLFLGYDIQTEPMHRNHSPAVEALGIDAIEAMHAGDGRRAEELLRQALEQEPDAVDLQNNLASAFQLQGRIQEGEEMVRQIFARQPDYFFARAAVARLETRAGHLDKARELLGPLLTRRRLHATEFNALCAAQIDWLLAKGERDGARTWFEMWEKANPNNPLLDDWRGRVRKPTWKKILDL